MRRLLSIVLVCTPPLILAAFAQNTFKGDGMDESARMPGPNSAEKKSAGGKTTKLKSNAAKKGDRKRPAASSTPAPPAPEHDRGTAKM